MVISHAGVLDTQLPREESWEGEWERIFVKHRSWNFSIQQIWKWQMREKGGEGGELRYEHPRFFEKEISPNHTHNRHRNPLSLPQHSRRDTCIPPRKKELQASIPNPSSDFPPRHSFPESPPHPKTVTLRNKKFLYMHMIS